MGKTETARLALGLAALGRPAYINLGRVHELPASRDVESMRATAFAVLDAAYTAGVRWVDAARSYGFAERFLGQWLTERGHRDVFVSSKWGYSYVGDWRLDAEVHEVKDHALETFRRQWRQSTDELGSSIALYQAHSLTPDSPLFGDHALHAALAELRDGGVRVGFSTSGAAQAEVVRRAFELESGGLRVFDSVQSTWNPLEPSVGPALAEAHADGARVILKEVLANGRLAVSPPPGLARLADRAGQPADAIALAAALAQPFADAVLLGSSSVEQLTMNLRALDCELGPNELDGLRALAEDPAAYWRHRADLAWR